MNRLPKGWALRRISEVGEVRLGRQRSPKNRSSKYPTKYIRAANLTWNGLDLTDVLDMEFEPRELDAYRLEVGDVLLSEASGSAGEVGKPVVWKGELKDCCFQNTVVRFRPGDAVLPAYSHVVFSHFARNGVFARISKGVGIHHLSADRFAGMDFPVPPLDEQQRIVAKIEELFSDLDAGVAALERVRANLKRYRAAVLKAAVEGRLTEQWRRQNPPAEPADKLLARILAERRKKWEEDQLRKYAEAAKTPPKDWHGRYKEPPGPGREHLPKLPSSWVWCSADQLCAQITDGEHIQPPYTPRGRPMLTATHVRNSQVEFKSVGYISEEDFARCLKRCAPRQNDVLVVSVGATTGRAGLVGEVEPFAIVRSVLLLRPLIRPRHLLRWIQSPWCQQWITRASGASAQAHFYISDTKRMPVPLPPLNEQDQILDDVERRLSLVESVEAEVEHGLARATRLRRAILKRAFEGKLVPQDSTDAPASALLERIKIDRASTRPSGRPQRVVRLRKPNERSSGTILVFRDRLK